MAKDIIYGEEARKALQAGIDRRRYNNSYPARTGSGTRGHEEHRSRRKPDGSKEGHAEGC